MRKINSKLVTCKCYNSEGAAAEITLGCQRAVAGLRAFLTHETQVKLLEWVYTDKIVGFWASKGLSCELIDQNDIHIGFEILCFFYRSSCVLKSGCVINIKFCLILVILNRQAEWFGFRVQKSSSNHWITPKTCDFISLACAHKEYCSKIDLLPDSLISFNSSSKPSNCLNVEKNSWLKPHTSFNDLKIFALQRRWAFVHNISSLFQHPN